MIMVMAMIPNDNDDDDEEGEKGGSCIGWHSRFPGLGYVGDVGDTVTPKSPIGLLSFTSISGTTGLIHPLITDTMIQ
jgi:hypothetical protein